MEVDQRTSHVSRQSTNTLQSLGTQNEVSTMHNHPRGGMRDFTVCICRIGKKISTKGVGNNNRIDITGMYKFTEGKKCTVLRQSLLLNNSPNNSR